jgi:hypothetical protein
VAQSRSGRATAGRYVADEEAVAVRVGRRASPSSICSSVTARYREVRSLSLARTNRSACARVPSAQASRSKTRWSSMGMSWTPTKPRRTPSPAAGSPEGWRLSRSTQEGRATGQTAVDLFRALGRRNELVLEPALPPDPELTAQLASSRRRGCVARRAATTGGSSLLGEATGRTPHSHHPPLPCRLTPRCTCFMP